MSIWSRLERKINDLADGLVLDEYRDQVAAARNALQSGDSTRAIELTEALLKAKPDHGQALIVLGHAYLTDEHLHPQRALHAFDKALAARGDDPEAQLGRGIALLHLAQYAAAVSACARAVAEAGGDRGLLAQAYRGAGLAWLHLGDADKAMRELRKAIAENNSDVLARAALAQAIVIDDGALDEAERHIERVLGASVRQTSDEAPRESDHGGLAPPNHTPASAASAATTDEPPPAQNTSGGNSDEHAPPLSLLQQQAHAHAYFARATLALRKHQPRAAQLDATAGHALLRYASTPWQRTQRVLLALVLGEAALQNGTPALAIEVLEPSVLLLPKSAPAHAQLAAAYAAMGDRHRALASFDCALQLARTPAATATSDTAPRTARLDVNATAAPSPAGAGPIEDLVPGNDRAPHDEHTADRTSPELPIPAPVLRQSEHLTILRAAVDAAIVLADPFRAYQWSLELLGVEPHNTRALVARGLGATANGDLPAARGFLDVAMARGDLDAYVIRAQLQAGSDPAAAIATLQSALRIAPDHPRVRAALAGILQQSAPSPTANDLGDIATALEHVLAQRPELTHHVGEVARATAQLDQPLLVTVMGEFSSGKSSFVNAFVGADVAPTGITPTTATINVLKYGHERAGRIIYADGTRPARNLPWQALFAHLRALSAAEAAAIERVEILVPLAALERIHIVDTPGLNSILPEHEATARAFIARADAVIWVFTANQGGKASERRALQTIANEGRRVLGVLNKADQLSDEEVAEVVAFVGSSLHGLVECIVPFSARNALAAKQADGVRVQASQPPSVPARAAQAATSDATTTPHAATSATTAAPTATTPHSLSLSTDGNWFALAAALESRFFSQARQLKQAACARRLRAIVETAQLRLQQLTSSHAEGVATIEQLRAALQAQHHTFHRDAVVPERKRIVDAGVALYHRVAGEVIALVQPRKLPFASHSATHADSEYVVALLDAGYHSIVDDALNHLTAALLQHIEPLLLRASAAEGSVQTDIAADLFTVLGHQRAHVREQGMRARSYLRGVLAGGLVDTFFRADVPKLALSEDAVFHALFRNAPNLDRELALPLATALDQTWQALDARIAYWASATQTRNLTIELGAQRALHEIAHCLERITDAAPIASTPTDVMP